MRRRRSPVAQPQRVVGIGASAGGLDALKQLVGAHSGRHRARVRRAPAPPAVADRPARESAGAVDRAAGDRRRQRSSDRGEHDPRRAAAHLGVLFRGALVLRTANGGCAAAPADRRPVRVARRGARRARGRRRAVGHGERRHRGAARDPVRGWPHVRSGSVDRAVRRDAAQRDRGRRGRDRAPAGRHRRWSSARLAARTATGPPRETRRRPPRIDRVLDAAARGERDRLHELQAHDDRAPARARLAQASFAHARRVQRVPRGPPGRSGHGLRGSADPRHRVLSRSPGARDARRAASSRVCRGKPARCAGPGVGPGLLDRRGGLLARDAARSSSSASNGRADPVVRHRPQRARDRDRARAGAIPRRSRRASAPSGSRGSSAARTAATGSAATFASGACSCATTSSAIRRSPSSIS